jgi:hypothetical protein
VDQWHVSFIRRVIPAHSRSDFSHMIPSLSPAGRSRLTEPVWSDPDVPLVVIDLASVETYFLVRALSGLAVEGDGAMWCPLMSEPAPLDLDIDAARDHASRLQLPFVRPPLHPSPLPRAMRLAALAGARSRAALFTVLATRLAWSTGADLDRLGGGADAEDGDKDLEEYLPLIMGEIGVDVGEAKLAAEAGSDWDLELHSIAAGLAELGIDSAPALRWRRRVYTGHAAISAVLP